MDLSVFLAKILGVYMFFMAVSIYVNLPKLRSMMSHENGPMFMYATGARTMLFGLVIITCHNIWVWDGDCWKTVITLMGWLLFFRGIERVLFPDSAYRMLMRALHSHRFISGLSLIMLIIGSYLAYFGFVNVS